MKYDPAHHTLNKVYAAEHQVLFELVKSMAIQTSVIVAALQGGEVSVETAHGYVPTPCRGVEG